MPVMVAAPLKVTRAERSELKRMARSGTLPHRTVVQARGLLLAARGVANNQIARECDTTADTVRRWRTKFEAGPVEAVGAITPGAGPQAGLPSRPSPHTPPGPQQTRPPS